MRPVVELGEAGWGKLVNGPFVWVVDASEGDILLVLEQTVEVWVVAVEAELGEEELDVGSDQGPVA